jgi:hypothetical protein
MFAPKSCRETATRILVIAVILFNALVPTAASASSLKKYPGHPSADIENNISWDHEVRPSQEEEYTQAADPTATPEPSSPGLEQDTPPGPPTVLLSITPDYLTPNSNLTLSWTIQNISIEESTPLSLQITLPNSFSVEGNSAGSFDEASHTLTIPITVSTGQLFLNEDDSTADVTLRVVLFNDTESLAEASLSLSVHEEFVMPPGGGSVETDDGKVEVQFPNGVFPESAVIDIGKPSGDEAPPSALSSQAFEIKAHTEDTGQEVSQFPKEISLVVSYADLNVPPELRVRGSALSTLV